MKKIKEWWHELLKKLQPRKQLIEELHKSNDFWYEQYIAEHASYMAMLSMYNETKTVKHAIRVIANHCENTDHCDKCNYVEAGKCKFAHKPPCQWED